MTLLQPWFLLGLLGLGIPVLLHLFELRRPQRVLFTNVDFIRDVKLVTAKQRRLQHLLVLAFRLGFVAFLVLLFCQPFLKAKQQTSAMASQVDVVLDDSPSMAAEASDGKSLLERAGREAEYMTAAFPATAQYRLWAANTDKGGLSGQMLKEALAGAEVSGANKGAGDALRRLLHQQQGQRPTFVLTDFQRSDFDRSVFAAMRGAGEVYLLPLSAKPAANVYADSIYLVDEFVRVGVDLPLQVRLRNGGNQEAAVQVRVLVGDRQVGAFEATLAAGASRVQTVRLRLTNQEAQLCRVEIDDQPVAFDNTHYFTLTPAGKIRIVDVSSGNPATQRLYPNETGFNYALAAPGAVATSTGSADMLLLQGDARLSAAARTAVRSFVNGGGTVIVVPPATATIRQDYEPLLADLGLTSVRWNATSGGGMQELALPDQQSPFFKDVFSEQTRQPEMPRATPVLTWSRSTTDVLKFRDGQPFLSGFRSGEGMVYVFAAPLQPQYSTFAAHPLFVPVMYRLAALSKTSEQLPAYRLTDRSVVLRPPVLKTSGEQLYKLSNDSSSFVLGHQVRNGQLYLQLPPTLRQPGFYRLTLDGQAVTTLAFNVNKQESELARYSAAELRELTAAYPNVHVYEAGGERSAAAQFAEERTGTPLWRYCLLAALLCLLGEVLVLRFGQRRAAVAQAA